MRIALLAASVLVGCSPANVFKSEAKLKPEPVSKLCRGHETPQEADKLPENTPQLEMVKRGAVVMACLWDNAVMLAPAPDTATLVGQSVMHECSIHLATYANSLVKHHYPDVAEAAKKQIISEIFEDWEKEAISKVIQARAGKCKTVPDNDPLGILDKPYSEMSDEEFMQARPK